MVTEFYQMAGLRKVTVSLASDKETDLEKLSDLLEATAP